MEFLVRRSLFANLLTLLIFGLGIYSLLNLPREVFPNVDYDVVSITTGFPGASPEQVERLVTNPIETELKSVSGIRDLYGTSVEGFSNIHLELDPNVSDKDGVITEIQRAVERVENLPEETDRPLVTEIKSTDNPILLLALRKIEDISAEYEPSLELRDRALELQRELERVPGVSQVKLAGKEDLEFIVEFQTHRLRELGISVDEVVQAFRTQNFSTPAGEITRDQGAIRYRVENELTSADKIKDVIIRSTIDGQTFRVRDLATVRMGQEESAAYVRSAGNPAIVLEILKRDGMDAIHVVDGVKEVADKYLDRINQDEKSWDVAIAGDMSIPVRTRLNALSSSIVLGGILVFILLFLALDMRTASVVAIGIPFSFLGALLLLPLFGFSLNLLTMFGFVVVLGMLVDDAIVVSESIFTEMENGKSPYRAVVDGTNRVIKPVIGSVMTTVLAFAPLVFMSGIFGKFVSFIPSVVIFCLLVSLVEAFFVLPNHMHDFVRVSKRTSEKVHAFDRLRDFYRKLITLCLQHRWKVTIGSWLFIGIALFAQFQLGRFILFPKEGIEIFFIQFEGDPKLSLAEMTERILPVEAELAKLPSDEVYAYLTNIGSIQGGGVESRRQGSNYSQITVFLRPVIERKLSTEQIIERIRPVAEKTEGMESVQISEAGGGPPTGKPVSIMFQADDLEVLRKVVAEARQKLEAIPGVRSIGDSDLPGKTEYRYNVNFSRVLQAGVNPQNAASALQFAVDGKNIYQVRGDLEAINLRLKAKEDASPEEILKNLSVLSNMGELVPVTSIIDAGDPSRGVYAIQHYQGQRGITLYGEVDEDITTSGEVNAQMAKYFPEWKSKYQGLGIEALGGVRDTKESLDSLKRSALLALSGVFFVMILTLGSLWQPVIVFSSVPLGLAGVIFTFILHNRPLSFLALFGIVGLVGVAVNVGIVLVDRINSLRKEMSYKDALIEGSAQRLRAILLTSATTVFGLMPTAYGWGGGDPFLKSMALALGWGIAFASILGLITIPVYLSLFEDIAAWFRKFKGHHYHPKLREISQKN